MKKVLPIYVYSRDGKERGLLINTSGRCGEQGCWGHRYIIRWPDGKRTAPCSKGLRVYKKRHYKII